MADILIGDDLAFALHSTQVMLENLGHTIIGQATNAVEAIRLYRQLKPDLTILDIKGMNSFFDEEQKNIDTFEAIKIIRRINHKAKIIVITATPEKEYIKSAILSEADDILVKGFNKDKLKKVLDKIIPKRHENE